MPVKILQDKVLLRPSDFQPLASDWEVIGSFNPAAVRYGDDIILLVRVVETPLLKKPDRLTSPRADLENGELEWVLDVFDPVDTDTSDPRFFILSNGRVRLHYISHLRLVRLSGDGLHVKEIRTIPDLLPREDWEELGIEDPRISKIGETYYITYVAISRHMGVATALMTTQDFQKFERHGIIFPTENKDVVLLPAKCEGLFLAYHRPVSNYWIDAPSVETALSPDAIYWGKHQFLFGPSQNSWDSVKIGAGPPPLRLPQGWLMIYHGVAPASPQSPGGVYCAGAVLLDGDNPLRLLARSSEPLICPDRSYEQKGFLPNVIFPTGSLLSFDEEEILLFAGAADEVTSLLVIPIESILEHLGIK
jgi:predicted GH43/DUF377 family glycosyl hydrolase